MKRVTPYFVPVDESHLRIEKAKARELRKSQWWKNQLAKSLCYYCNQRFEVQDLCMDHKIPISRGGKSVKTNVVVSCKECKQRKEIPTAFGVGKKLVRSIQFN